VLGVTGVVVSRGTTSAADIVREVTMPSIGSAETISVVSAAVEPYARVEKGDAIYEVKAGDSTRTVESPIDGTVAELLAAPGEEVAPGTRIATVQTGPDFNAANAAGSHWHTAYGINVCGSWLPPLGQFESDFHTHGDGLMHAHPRSNAAAGKNATAALFFERAGGELRLNKLRYAGETHESNETTCGEGKDEKKAVMRWALNGVEQKGNPANFVVGNGDVFVVAFIGEDDTMPTEPPSVAAMAQDYVAPKLPGYEAPDAAPDAAPGGDEAPTPPEGTEGAPETTVTSSATPTTTSGGSGGS